MVETVVRIVADRSLAPEDRTTIEEVLGERWLGRLSARLAQSIRAESRRQEKRRPDKLHLHPLAWRWLVCTGTMPTELTIGEDSESEVAWLHSLAVTFRASWPAVAPGRRESLVRRLRDAGEWRSCFYELRVAASYLNVGVPVEIVAEDDRRKTPDLFVSPSNTAPIAIECKKKDIITRRDEEYEDFYRDLAPRLRALLLEARLSVTLKIVSEVDPRRDEIPELLVFIRRELVRQPAGQVYDGRKYTITWGRLTEWGQQIEPSVTTYFPECDKFSAWFQAARTVRGRIVGMNPCAVGFLSRYSPDRLPGIKNSLRAAKSQLPEAGPGLVYVDIPLPPNLRFDEEVARLAPRIQEALVRSTHRVNAVVISASGMLGGGGTLPIFGQRSYIVHHPSPRTPMPEGFAIPRLTPIDPPMISGQL